MYNKYNTILNKREKSIITDLFYIGLVNKFICTCNYETYSFGNLLDLTLLIPTDINNTNVKLDDLLNDYFKTTNSEFNTVYNYCKIICVHKKEIKINKLPDILILSIQRIDFNKKIKNNLEIQFCDSLGVDKFCDLDFKNDNYIINYNL